MPESIFYRVKFKENEKSEKFHTLVCREVRPSEIFGLICLYGFVFKENPLVIDPSENEARLKYENTERLHLPHHLILSVEEFFDEDSEAPEEPELTLAFESKSREGEELPH